MATGDKGTVTVKGIDMDEEMKADAIQTAKTALANNKNATEQELAEIIKVAFDQQYSPTWHCVVGKSFGSFVTYESHHFIHFQIDALAFVLFRAG